MWTAAALSSEAGPYSGEAWRVVESQAPSATVRVTDTLSEQERLERLLDQSKPALPERCAGFDFLLATPFRYWPYPTGSRFRRARQSEGVFYASETVDTAMSELAFHHTLFFLEAPDAVRPVVPVEMTAFSVLLKTAMAIDLTAPPLAADGAHWQHPSDYSHCQDLADQARLAGVSLIRYGSIRSPRNGTNLAALDLTAFAEQTPRQRQTWHLFMRETAVQAWCECPILRLQFEFDDWGHRDPRFRPADLK